MRGIEFDYEMDDTPLSRIGVVTEAHARAYSEFLWNVKRAAGMRVVAADVMVWGVAPGNWVLGALPWVLPGFLRAGKIDWVSKLSYVFLHGPFCLPC